MKTLFASIKITVAFCVIFFVGYVLVLWGFAYVVQPNQGQAQVVMVGETVVGAVNVGQQFTKVEYFWGRPSAVDYNGGGSGGSNKSVTNPDYLQAVEARVVGFLNSHPYLERSDVPSELVTASASGLDPHISPQSAVVQIGRVALSRGMSEDRVAAIVIDNTERPVVGQPYINVLKLNIALDNETNN